MGAILGYVATSIYGSLGFGKARDSYYSGRPLILDDMFDKVELKLRWYGSRSVVKYPRCSLKRQSTYADAEVDHSQTLALASIWASLLVFGIIALVAPPVCTVSVIYQDAVHMQLTPHSSMLASKSLTAANGILAIVLSSSIGYPITVSAGRALQGLWRNDLVALKGSCPGCGEEVFAFVRADESVRPRHKTECHVCERPLVFHAKVENSMSNPGSRWVHGRVYLVARLKDLGPQGSQ
ncbi:PGR5-like protein 1A, chloroplastic isoform X5 [Cryptomeria japonica]|nr:PGR5-like protein 1A, chloroplastic isoform X5 [Cryptomeria japonica]